MSIQAFTGWHIAVLAVWIVPFVLWLIALIQIARSRAEPTPLLWILLITIIPILGPIVWWAGGRHSVTPSTPH